MVKIGKETLFQLTDLASLKNISYQRAKQMLKENLIEPPAGKIGNTVIWSSEQYRRMEAEVKKAGKAA